MMKTNKCVFLDRDGVLNEERGDYTYRTADFIVIPGVVQALQELKSQGYLLVVITNQAGIAKGRYTREDVKACHQKLQEACGHLLDALYYAPAHPSVSESLSRKPGSLMLEKAMARFHIDPASSWMVGDRLRDIAAAQQVGVAGILVGDQDSAPAGVAQVPDLAAAARYILQQPGRRA
ncbi:MAG: D-glycero-alpha-D-manno-heptose-1,7-bisphosphate 7-phosphatase [Adhaeribacter sp.]